MGVEPQDEQIAPRLGREPGDAADRAHGDAVIAAEHDRRPPRAGDRIGFAGKQPRPGCDLGEPMGLALGYGQVNQWGRRSEIAPVLDVVAEVPQRFYDARCAQHGRSHRGAWHARSRLDGRAENGDRAGKRQKRPAFQTGCALLPAQDVSLRMNSGETRRDQSHAPNERNVSPSEIKRNGKPLKSLGAKLRDFAESCVFKGLTGFSFRRFPARPSKRMRGAPASAISRSLIVAEISEELKDSSRPISPPARTRVLTRKLRLAIACAS